MKEIVTFLKDLRDEVLIFPNNDLLVQINSKKTFEYVDRDVQDDSTLIKIIREARIIEKKTGINPTCVSEGIIRIESNSKTTPTPVFLTPVEIHKNKITNTSKLVKMDDEKILNPYLISLFDISMETEGLINDFESFFRVLDVNPENCEKDISFIGNFHPKRFSFLREIEELIDEQGDFSDALKAVFGTETNANLTLKSTTPLYRNDEDQLRVYEQLSDDSIVVQGPPGTGKSQVIGNVIGNILESGQTALLTSEKKVALDVIQSKLNTRKIDVLTFQIPSRHPNRAFIQELKKGWDYFNQLKKKPLKESFKNFKEQKKIFEQLVQEANRQGCSSHDLFQLIEKHKGSGLVLNKESNITLSVFEASNEILEQVPEKLRSIARTFKPFILENEFLRFSNELDPVINVLNELKSIRKVEAWEELQQTLYQLLQFHSFKQSSYKKFGHFINVENTELKRIEREYYDIKRTLESLKQDHKNWLLEPSNEELEFLNDLCQKKHLFKYKFKWYFTWKKWSRTPEASPETQIKNRIKYNKKKKRHDIIMKKLFDLEIQDPDSELPLIKNLIQNTDLNHWNLFLREEQGNQKHISHKRLYRTIDFLKHSFEFQTDDKPLEILNNLSSLKKEFLEAWPKLKKLPIEIFPFLKEDIKETQASIEYTISNQIKIQYPELTRFSITSFLAECNNINDHFDEESEYFAEELVMKQFELFNKYEELTKSTPRKLSVEEKSLRMKLKKGKSLLVKEFGKKRAHQSIRNLFNSEAIHWIKVLKPIWMSNPNVLAESIPLKKELFDFVIADEASQLLLSHSVGALQRGKKTIICGDPQQMSPSSFFKKKQRLEIDLLHHANYYLKSVFLSNHYRSVHPQLIAFSNNYFYNKRLKAFQDVNAIDPPIQHHYVESGRFIERKNEAEAKKIAEFISKQIRNNEKLGVVAFSETQLECIYENLSNEVRQILERRIEKDSLFFQSLEKVQGDECDRLIISFGYGFNIENKFEMRFGPVNFDQGHKRLNVLFSRAKRSIDFFSSVKHIDFPKTENLGVLHVKKWFELVENQKPLRKVEQNILLSDILLDCNGFNDLISYLHVYYKRGYNIQH